MNLQQLRDLLDFNYWARDRMLAAVEALTPEQFTRDVGNSFRSVRDTLAHIIFAEWVWLSRWQGESPTAPLSPDMFPDLATIRTMWLEQEVGMRAYLDSLGEDGLARVIDYKLLNGTPGSSVFWMMLQHVVNHGSYHRGQVTTMLRQFGAAPPQSTDLITFYRERGR